MGGVFSSCSLSAQHGDVSCRRAAPAARPGASAASNRLAGFFDRGRECVNVGGSGKEENLSGN